MAWLLYLMLAFLFALFLWKYSANEESQTLKSIPGPDGWPILGNLLQMCNTSGNPHVLFLRWAKEYGPIYKVKLGSKWAVVVNKYDTIYEVLVKRGKDFSGRDGKSFRMKAIGYYPYGVAFTDMDDEHVITKKAIHTTLKSYGHGPGRLEAFAKLQTQNLLDALEASNGELIDPQQVFNTAALKMSVLFTFGEYIEVGSKDFDEFVNLNESLHRVIAPGFAGELLDLMPWLRYFGYGLYKEITKANEITNAFWKRFYTDRKDAWIFDSSENKCLVETMFHFNQMTQKKYPPISEKYMCSTAVQSIAGGVITTACTVYSFFNILLHYPEVQSKIYSEIKSVIGDKKVSYEDKKNFPYTCASILELHRFLSVIPLGIPHKAVIDSEIQGYKIPKDALIFTNLAALHHDEEFWDHPEIFRPERFLDETGNLLENNHANVSHVKPFGAGVRLCIGENIATVRLFIWIVSILQRFLVQGEPLVPCHMSSYSGDLIICSDPYKIRFVLRS